MFYFIALFAPSPPRNYTWGAIRILAEIKTVQGEGAVSGDYWLDLQNTGKAIQIFCLGAKGPFNFALDFICNEREVNFGIHRQTWRKVDPGFRSMKRPGVLLPFPPGWDGRLPSILSFISLGGKRNYEVEMACPSYKENTTTPSHLSVALQIHQTLNIFGAKFSVGMFVNWCMSAY